MPQSNRQPNNLLNCRPNRRILQPEDIEPQPFELPHGGVSIEPSLVETGIDVADLEGLGANQTHYLGGEPLNLKEGVHPPEGFGEVSVDFSQPPAVRMESPARPGKIGSR